MSATLTPYQPLNAIPVWTDGRRIFANVHGHIMAFSLSESGLSKVLSLMIQHRVEYAGTPVVSQRPLVGTPSQHAAAESLLRKHGVIK